MSNIRRRLTITLTVTLNDDAASELDTVIDPDGYSHYATVLQELKTHLPHEALRVLDTQQLDPIAEGIEVVALRYRPTRPDTDRTDNAW